MSIFAGLHSLCWSGAACAPAAGKCSTSLKFPSQHLDKWDVMQATGGTGNQMFPPAAALFSNR